MRTNSSGSLTYRGPALTEIVISAITDIFRFSLNEGWGMSDWEEVIKSCQLSWQTTGGWVGPLLGDILERLGVKESASSWQKEWDNGETGRSVHNVLPKVKTTPTPWQRPEIMFVTGCGPFPTYLKRFNIRSSDSCGCGNLGNPLHYATSCLFTTSYHLTKPSADLEPLWWKRVMNNNNSRAKIRKLIHFIKENETLISKRWRQQLATDPNNPMYSYSLFFHT
ncbi:hypothetical protein AVEN_145664-1 [Araneus ventricosus]|uniref:Reverse transcriptase domain-containing protein n=1 Tax=Araneus ventricosus TaxID=182803 RepID=A0A4Y2KWJ4_ARAVE|nr:hypothetical protein AVEN_145664-1 [Araneus ventricosus]